MLSQSQVKGKEYLIRQGKMEGFLQSWGTQRHARTRWRNLDKKSAGKTDYKDFHLHNKNEAS